MTSMSSSIHPNVRVDNPTHVINVTKQVLKVEMSPFDWSHNLICIAHIDEIIIGIVKFQVCYAYNYALVLDYLPRCKIIFFLKLFTKNCKCLLSTTHKFSS